MTIEATSKRSAILTIQAYEGVAKTNIISREVLLPSHMLYERVEEVSNTVWRQVCQDLAKRLEVLL